MLFLDKDLHALLNYLLELESPQTIMAISKKLYQSRRKIYYNLEKVNEAFSSEVDPIVSIPRVGLCLTDKQKQACRELLEELDASSYVLNMEERIQLLLIYILISPNRVTIERMMDLADVSRNTILNDLNEIRERLSQDYRYLPLAVTKRRGYFLNCHLLDKIQFLYSLLFTVLTSSNSSFLSIFEKKIQQIVGDNPLFDRDFAADLMQRLKDVRQVWGKEMYDSEMELMVEVIPYLLLSYRNSELSTEEREDVIKELALVRTRIEYKVARQISSFLCERHTLTLDDIEEALVAILLLSSRKNYDKHVNTLDFRDIEEAIEVFLQAFERQTNYQLVQRSELAQRLLIHCKALLFRKTYGILSTNPLTQQVKSKYKALFEVTATCVSILEKAWLVKLTDDDIAHIVIHIGGVLRSVEIENPNTLVCLVCDEGVAVQKLLVKQIEYHFPNITVAAVFTTEQFKSVEDILHVDALIQTSDSLETAFPTIQVCPILSQDDLQSIAGILRFPSISFGLEQDQTLEALIAEYISDTAEQAAFKTKLQQALQNSRSM
ncbi:BglG family transcription antiterminator [Streptococcus cameli]